MTIPFTISPMFLILMFHTYCLYFYIIQRVGQPKVQNLLGRRKSISLGITLDWDQP